MTAERTQRQMDDQAAGPRFRASHPQGRSEAEDPGGAAGGVDGRERGGTLGMLRTG
jgi:hypothetical protein